MNPFAEPVAVLSRKGVERLQHGHPWVYRSDVATVPRAASGDVVALTDQRGRFQGKAFWSERSQIAVRLLSRDEEPIDEEFFARRIASAAALRRVAFGEETLWRAVHGESDLLPGLVADRYGDVGVIQTLVPAPTGARSSWPGSWPASSGCGPCWSGTTSGCGSWRGSPR